jgi:hypothetical protein
MSYQLYPSDLTDREWDLIKPLIPPCPAPFKGRVLKVFQQKGRRAGMARQLSNGILGYYAYFSEPEEGDVLPERSVSMDRRGH